ncbi:MAG: hypothetical protein ACE5NC_02185, partial [Anaerolineae bacterium]
MASEAPSLTFSYTHRYVRVYRVSLILVAILGVFQWLLAWIRAGIALGMQLADGGVALAAQIAWDRLIEGSYGFLYRVGLGHLVRAHLALLLLLLVIYLFYNLLPEIKISSTSLNVRFFRRWLWIPWGAVQEVISVEGDETDRIVVLIRAEPRHLRLAHRLGGLLLGIGPRPGFLVTSDIQDFGRLIATIVSHVEAASRGVRGPEDIVTETQFSPLVSMTVHSVRTLNTLMERSVPASPQTLFRIWTVLAVVPGILVLWNAGVRGTVAGFFLLVFPWTVLEAFAAPLGIFTLSDLFGGDPRYAQIARVYPYTQLPRLWVAPIFGLAIGAQLPTLLIVPVAVL